MEYACSSIVSFLRIAKTTELSITASFATRASLAAFRQELG